MAEKPDLFRTYPQLAVRVPHVGLCDLPTPVAAMPGLGEALGIESLHVKRDDLSAREYGGNKVRKLEFLLADAAHRGCREVLTFGFAGSNFAAACAHYARCLDLGCVSMLLPQENAAYLRDNLLVGLAAGAELHERDSVPALAADAAWQFTRHWLRHGRRPYWIPAGGSSPTGVLGFVNAAFELRAQVEAGDLPEPDRLYLAMGSMGSAAGLAIGLRAAGLSTRVVAVRVVEKKFAGARLLDDLLHQCCGWIGNLDSGFPVPDPAQLEVEVRDEFFGGGYGVIDSDTAKAIRRTAELEHLGLDGTYSGKAMTALFRDAAAGACAGKRVLFWSTFNSRPLAPLLADLDHRRLPTRLQRYFRDGER